MEKKCNKCKEVKPVSEFHKNARAKNGYKPRCKKCLNEYYNLIYPKIKARKLKTARAYYQRTKAHQIEKSRLYRENNKEAKAKYNREYREKNIVRLRKNQNEYEKNRVKTNSEYRTLKNMRKFIYRLQVEKNGKTSEILGYDIVELEKKLGRFPNEGESIDHKIPVSWFIVGAEPKIVSHLDNLQILTRMENSKKGNLFCDTISIEYYNEAINYIKEEYKLKIRTNE